MKYVRLLRIVLPVLAVVVAALLIYHFVLSKPSYSTATVTEGTIVDEVSASGNVSSVQNVDLSFIRSGTVSTEPAQVGTVVHTGEVVARLDTSTLESQLQAAKAAVALARAQGGTTATSASTVQQTQDTLVANAYQNLLTGGLAAQSQTPTSATAPTISGTYNGAEGTYQITIQAIQPGHYTIQTNGIENTGPLPISNTGPTNLGTHGLTLSFPENLSNYANTTWYVTIPNTQSSVYAANLSTYNAAVATRAQAVATAEANTTPVAGVSASQAQLENAEANVADIQTQIDQSTITAPFDGTITTENAKEGAAVSAGEPLITVATSGTLEVDLDVSEDNIANVQVGDPVRMTLDAFGNENFKGKVVEIDPAAETIGGAMYYKTTVVFNNPDPRIREGMTVNAYIQTATAANALMVPASAVTTSSDGSSTVTVIENGVQKTTSVTTGLENQEGMVQIVSGLSKGDVVVTGAQP